MKWRIALIAALAPNMGIGEGDQLPWRMPRDMKFFRLTTRNHVVMMGRRTFESLGCRPLPKRFNIVLSRTKSYKADNLLVARSIEEAIDMGLHVTKRSRLFVIGGGNLYRQAIEFADEMYLTYIEKAEATDDLFGEQSFHADTFFPSFNEKDWVTCHVSRHYRALDSLRAPPEVKPSYYFRFWKLARTSIGCTESESRHLMRRFGSTQLELPFWDRTYLKDGRATPHM
jgi:dihydrofolate reductase